MTVLFEHTSARSLISPPLFARLVRRVVADDGVTPELAERIVDQALAFLGACAREHTEPLSPSEVVDLGWHAFLLHTRDYADFCDRIAGRFLHHVPTDEDNPTATGTAAQTIARTVAAIDAAGFNVDPALWPSGKLNCTGCANGCHDDPPPDLPLTTSAAHLRS